jgi:hypothetical protein
MTIDEDDEWVVSLFVRFDDIVRGLERAWYVRCVYYVEEGLMGGQV